LISYHQTTSLTIWLSIYYHFFNISSICRRIHSSVQRKRHYWELRACWEFILWVKNKLPI